MHNSFSTFECVRSCFLKGILDVTPLVIAGMLKEAK